MTRRSIVLVGVASCLVLPIAACGGDGGDGEDGDSGGQGGEATKITHEQWLAVSSDSTKEQVTGELGEPEQESVYEGLTDSISYTGSPGDVSALFTFDPDSGDFMSKEWTESTSSKDTVSAADFGRVSNGMTEGQVETLLGEPSLRVEYLTTGTTSETGQPITPGTLQRCNWYVWTPESPYAASICFDQGGKVNEKSHTSPAPA